MVSSSVYPADVLYEIKNKLRFVQELLLHRTPEKTLEFSAEGAEGMYLLLEEAQDDLSRAKEMLETP